MGPFTASQINEQKFAAVVDSLFLDFDLGDGVTATRRIICLSRMRRTHLVALLDQVEDLVIVVDELLFESGNLDGIRLIFSEFELIMFVEQVIDLATIYFVHGHRDCEITLMVLPVIDSALKQIFHCNTLYAIHGVCLAGSRLSVCENGHDALVEDEVENGPNLIEIKFLVGLMLAEGIIEFEFRVFNRFGDAIYLVFAVVHENLRVNDRDHVDLSVRELMMEDWPLLEANTYPHLVSKRVRLLSCQLFLFILNHGLEIDVDLDPLQLIVGLALALKLADLFHLQTAGISVDFDLIDFISSCHLALNVHQSGARHV